MDDLVRWLGEQLDKDERIARAAGDKWRELPGNWVAAEGNHRVAMVLTADERAHIAAHDPARVLREVDAKREMIREYEKAIRMRDRLEPNASGYRHWDNRSFGLYVALQHVATVYADRPGYAEALAAEKAALLADE